MSADEFILVHELYLRMTFISERDFNFFRWILPLQAVRSFMEQLRPNLGRRELQKGFWSIEEFGRQMFFSPHEYFGMKNQEYREGRARIHWQYERKRTPPIQRYIGVGYKDKGNCRDLSWNGEPSMRELARDERIRNKWMEDPERPDFLKHYLGSIIPERYAEHQTRIWKTEKSTRNRVATVERTVSILTVK